LLYDTLVVNQLILKIPHPLITEREFVLKPLFEIAPELVHPITGITFATYFFKLKK
jgi:2-amino-4-hydroxy-6-hydroxymethyldihydropteridine diphosphokinase